MKALDTEGFQFYISSATGAGRQQETGTPYPPSMLESAGLGGLAKTLPSAASKELYDRVASYITDRKSVV